jgi:hypothetical protein
VCVRCDEFLCEAVQHTLITSVTTRHREKVERQQIVVR